MAKSEKTCIVCGEKFDGTAKAKVCSGGCRIKLKRTLDKGQKLPDKPIASKKISEVEIVPMPPLKKLTSKEATNDTRQFSNAMLEIRKKKLGL